MSGLSTQGVAAACADAAVVSTLSAAAIKRVLVDRPVIPHPPGYRFEILNGVPTIPLNKPRTIFARQYNEGPVRGAGFSCDFVISRLTLRDYLPVSV
jgi:hypothetical protein